MAICGLKSLLTVSLRTVFLLFVSAVSTGFKLVKSLSVEFKRFTLDLAVLSSAQVTETHQRVNTSSLAALFRSAFGA